MKVSDSAPSEVPRLDTRRAIPYAIALAYLLAHLPFLAPSLEDIDSINFALGLHHFDPALHQPHPPGYPVYIALGRLSLAAIRVVASVAGPDARGCARARCLVGHRRCARAGGCRVVVSIDQWRIRSGHRNCGLCAHRLRAAFLDDGSPPDERHDRVGRGALGTGAARTCTS
jgi:hypothetical protein